MLASRDRSPCGDVFLIDSPPPPADVGTEHPPRIVFRVDRFRRIRRQYMWIKLPHGICQCVSSVLSRDVRDQHQKNGRGGERLKFQQQAFSIMTHRRDLPTVGRRVEFAKRSCCNTAAASPRVTEKLPISLPPTCAIQRLTSCGYNETLPSALVHATNAFEIHHGED